MNGLLNKMAEKCSIEVKKDKNKQLKHKF